MTGSTTDSTTGSTTDSTTGSTTDSTTGSDFNSVDHRAVFCTGSTCWWWIFLLAFHYNLEAYHLFAAEVLAAELLAELLGIEFARDCDSIFLLVIGGFYVPFFLVDGNHGGNFG